MANDHSQLTYDGRGCQQGIFLWSFFCLQLAYDSTFYFYLSQIYTKTTSENVWLVDFYSNLLQMNILTITVTYKLIAIGNRWRETWRLSIFYITCIRPVTEYVWTVYHDSLPQYLHSDIEKCQVTTLRIIFPHYSYQEMLGKAGIVTLCERRENTVVKLFKEVCNDPNHKLYQSNNRIPRNCCSWFNGAFIFKERRIRRNKLPTVAGYSVVKLFYIDWKAGRV